MGKHPGLPDCSLKGAKWFTFGVIDPSRYGGGPLAFWCTGYGDFPSSIPNIVHGQYLGADLGVFILGWDFSKIRASIIEPGSDRPGAKFFQNRNAPCYEVNPPKASP